MKRHRRWCSRATPCLFQLREFGLSDTQRGVNFYFTIELKFPAEPGVEPPAFGLLGVDLVDPFDVLAQRLVGPRRDRKEAAEHLFVKPCEIQRDWKRRQRSVFASGRLPRCLEIIALHNRFRGLDVTGALVGCCELYAIPECELIKIGEGIALSIVRRTGRSATALSSRVLSAIPKT